MSTRRAIISWVTQGSNDEAKAELSDDPVEQAAFEIVPRCLADGVRLEPYDLSGRQAVVDALLHYPDGRVAALEVTSAASEGTRQLYSLLERTYETLPNPGIWTWSATVDHPRDLPELAERCGRIILLCESEGVAHPKHAYRLRSDADISWLMRSSAELHGSPDLPKLDGDRERPLFVTPGGRGGSVNESLSRFATAVQDVLDEPHVKRRAAKLSRSGHVEQHLFVVIDGSAMPFDVAYALMARDVLPPSAPALPLDVTHLWLMTAFTPWVFLVTSGDIRRYKRSEV